jgi:two-component system sensor histidine kinase BaeS
MRSLRARITLVTVIVAVVAVAVTGLVSLGLIRSATTQEARDQLAAQATALAELRDPDAAAERLASADTQLAIVRDGVVTGDAADYVDQLILTRLANGENVSATRRGPLGAAMVEARVTSDSGALVLVRPLSSVDRTLGQATWRILLALGIGVLVAAAGALLLSRLLARQLTQTAEAARKLAAGERGVHFPATTTTEVAAVSAALGSLDAALATSEGRQREFLLSISHDLRTPLTAVRGYAEALADGMVSDVPAVGRTLVEETNRLDAFVRDLLELARLEADDFSIQPEAVDLDELLVAAAAAWGGRAATLGVTLRVTGAGGLVITDPRRLRQVVDGLVENAMRVTPEGGTIELAAAPARIDVLDPGPGLAPADLPVALERGLLHERYRDSRPVGTGLGLSIAARLVRRLGGTLAVANRPEGGAVFTVQLDPE